MAKFSKDSQIRALNITPPTSQGGKGLEYPPSLQLSSLQLPFLLIRFFWFWGKILGEITGGGSVCPQDRDPDGLARANRIAFPSLTPPGHPRHPSLCVILCSPYPTSLTPGVYEEFGGQFTHYR